MNKKMYVRIVQYCNRLNKCLDVDRITKVINMDCDTEVINVGIGLGIGLGMGLDVIFARFKHLKKSIFMKIIFCSWLCFV